MARLEGMVGRFCTALDCVDVGFIADGFLDELPGPSQLGATRVGVVDLAKPRMRHALAAALALTRVHRRRLRRQGTCHRRQTQGDYTTRQAAYDLRKLGGKRLIDKPGPTRRYHTPPQAARTIAALLTLGDQVIARILAGVRSPRLGRKPAAWNDIDRDYEQIRIHMETLLGGR